MIGLLTGIISGIIVLVGQSLIPLIVKRYWRWHVPDVYVTISEPYVIKEKGITNHRFSFILKLENGTDASLSFFTPRFYIRNKLMESQWEEASLITKDVTLGDIESGKAPLTPIFNTSYCMENPFQARKIEVKPHDFIESGITYNIYHSPTYYKKWFFGKPLIEGKIVVKPVGSKPITEYVYFDEVVKYVE